MNNLKKKRILWVSVCLAVVFSLIVLNFNRGDRTNNKLAFRQGEIKQFHGFPWGITHEKIRRQISRKPTGSNDIGPSFWVTGQQVKYRDELFGETIPVNFIFHHERGLVKGLYTVPFSRRSDCLKVYNSILNKFKAKYPDLLVNHGRYNRLRVPFCNAVLVGKAGRFHLWEDSVGNRITLVVGGEMTRRRVVVLIETTFAREWMSENSWIDQIW